MNKDTSPRTPGNQRPAAPPVLSTVLIALLLALIVLAAPSVGTWDLDARDVEITMPEPQPEELPGQEEPEEDARQEPEPEAAADHRVQISPLWGQVLMGLVIVLALVVAVAVIWVLLRNRRPFGPDGSRTDLQVDADVAPQEQIPVLARAATTARQELRAATDPADAIIRAWLALEQAAASSGVPRRPAHTPTDVTLAVLEHTRADPGATTGLLGLFHRARFGTTAMTADDRQQAIDHLQALAHSWDRVHW